MYNTTPLPKAQGISWKRGQKDRSTRGPLVCCDVVSLIFGKKASVMKSHQYGQLNKTYIMTPIIDMPVRLEKSLIRPHTYMNSSGKGN